MSYKTAGAITNSKSTPGIELIGMEFAAFNDAAIQGNTRTDQIPWLIIAKNTVKNKS